MTSDIFSFTLDAASVVERCILDTSRLKLALRHFVLFRTTSASSRSQLKFGLSQFGHRYNLDQHISNRLYSKKDCVGCGITLQSTSETNAGFIPKEVFDRTQSTEKICQRCFSLRNNNFTTPHVVGPLLTDDDLSLEKLLKKLSANASISPTLVYVLDLTDWPSPTSFRTFLKEFANVIRDTNNGIRLLILGNKLDLLSDAIDNHLEIRHHLSAFVIRNLRQVLNELKSGQKTGLEDVLSNINVLLVSAKKKLQFSSLLNYLSTHTALPMKNDLPNINEQSTDTDILPTNSSTLVKNTQQLSSHIVFTGNANAGKSQLINALLSKFHDASGNYSTGESDAANVYTPKDLKTMMKDSRVSPMITTSFIPGTTRDLITISSPSVVLVDTPGRMQDASKLTSFLTPSELKYVIPSSKALSPRPVVLHPGKTLFIGGIARIDHSHGDRYINLTCYVHNRLPLHLTSTDKADDLYSRWIFSGTDVNSPIFPPFSHSVRQHPFPPFSCDQFYIESNKENDTNCCDIVIPGLGWVALGGLFHSAKINVHIPTKKDASSTSAWIRVPPLIAVPGKDSK